MKQEKRGIGIKWLLKRAVLKKGSITVNSIIVEVSISHSNISWISSETNVPICMHEY